MSQIDPETGGPSANMSWKEMGCKDGTPYPVKWRREGRAKDLADIFEALRSMMGDKPITVLSAYRTPEHNRKVGGARGSMHLEGRALDIRTGTIHTVGEWLKELRRQGLKVGGIGLYPWGVHFDTRGDGRKKLVVWYSGLPKDSVTLERG